MKYVNCKHLNFLLFILFFVMSSYCLGQKSTPALKKDVSSKSGMTSMFSVGYNIYSEGWSASYAHRVRDRLTVEGMISKHSFNVLEWEWLYEPVISDLGNSLEVNIGFRKYFRQTFTGNSFGLQAGYQQVRNRDLFGVKADYLFSLALGRNVFFQLTSGIGLWTGKESVRESSYQVTDFTTRPAYWTYTFMPKVCVAF